MFQAKYSTERGQWGVVFRADFGNGNAEEHFVEMCESETAANAAVKQYVKDLQM